MAPQDAFSFYFTFCNLVEITNFQKKLNKKKFTKSFTELLEHINFFFVIEFLDLEFFSLFKFFFFANATFFFNQISELLWILSSA